MHPHENLITQFYSSFQQRDYQGMIACYHPDIQFSDPVFTTLKGKEPGAMWHMLCEAGQDLQLAFSNIQADEQQGQAHWEATYTFSATGRQVHNVLDAHFEFVEGRIIKHHDTFDLWRWTRMALGPMGVVLGWSPLVQNKVRQTARRNLQKFMQRHPEYQ